MDLPSIEVPIVLEKLFGLAQINAMHSEFLRSHKKILLDDKSFVKLRRNS